VTKEEKLKIAKKEQMDLAKRRVDKGDRAITG